MREDLDRLVEPTSQVPAALDLQERATGGGIEAPRAPAIAWSPNCYYSLQARKTLAGTEHPPQQFEHLDRAGLSLGEPVISVDTKKKELVGPFKKVASQGSAGAMHDFLIPSGPGPTAQNEAWVTDHDTAAFVVESIRRWWRGMGQALERHSCSNGYRLRLWNLEVGG